MSPIRPLERADLPQVAKLYEMVMRSGRSNPPPGLAPYFERMLLDHPWADPDIPSLVYSGDDGSIVAFQGSSVRHARFDGRPIRIACAGQLVAHPDARHRAVGALLVRAYLDGPQALTITDTASDTMRQIWTLLGGDTVHLACIGWVRVLRPWRFGAWYLLDRRKSSRLSSEARVLGGLDAASTRWIRGVSPPPAPDASGEPLTPSAIVEHLGVIGNQVRLHLDYDEPYLRWLFTELDVVRGLGTPVARLIRGPGGRILGWYVYCLAAAGVARVLQVAASDRHVGPVFDDLLHDAWSRGAIAVLGRVEPRLLDPLARRRCVLHRAGYSALSHSRDAEILGAISSGRSLLTRLDSEWWMQDGEVDMGEVR